MGGPWIVKELARGVITEVFFAAKVGCGTKTLKYCAALLEAAVTTSVYVPDEPMVRMMISSN